MKPYYEDGWATLYQADARNIPLADEAVDCCITSPPYWALRDYGIPGQLGMEATPDEYVCAMVEVFREVWRVLKPTGTLWLNLGDSYAANWRGGGAETASSKQLSNRGTEAFVGRRPTGLRPKDLVGIPWRVAFALQADGWYLRSDIIWHKPNPMPESVKDRPTKAHEYLFLLAKSKRYHYDHEAIKEPAAWARWGDQTVKKEQPGTASWIKPKTKQEIHESRRYAGFNERWDTAEANGTAPRSRNKRDVWTVATQPYKGRHFATFPEKLIEPCVMAGCPEGGLVLDPFIGSGTTASVAKRLKRNAVGCDLNASYLDLAVERISLTPAPRSNEPYQIAMAL